MSLPRLFLESLEPRIAPAVILAGPVSINGQPIGGNEYNSAGTPFKDASTVPTNDGTLSFVSGAGNYYLQLKAGDTLKMYSNQGFTNFITVSAGTVDAFFIDTNGTHIPTASELTGLSVSSGAKLVVSGSVNGDIIANLDAKSGAIEVNNLISNKQSIASLTVGDVSGSIIAGGGISKLSVGTVTDVASGISANTNYAFGGSPTVGAGTLTQFSANPAQGSGFLPAAKLAGASLANLQLNSATEIIAGSGGAGAAGGSITNVTLNSDTTGIIIQAGQGGSGSGTILSGGSGGQISQVVMYGPNQSGDTTDNSVIDMFGGAGGGALAGSTGAGGNGGMVSKVWVGYQPNLSGVLVPSQNWLHDNIMISGGDGGVGATAGNGGSVNGMTLLTSTPHSVADDIQIHGGNGGTLFAAGKKAGSGGSVLNINVQDLLDTASNAGYSTVLVEGGNASSTVNLTSLNCIGAAGGSISNAASTMLITNPGNAPLIGEAFDFIGGNGSNGTQAGGAGGSVSNLNFGTFNLEFLQSLSVTTGIGGSSTTGNGGIGGDLSSILTSDSTLKTLDLSIGNGGTSGNSTGGAIGGRGGNINSVSIAADIALDLNFAALTPTAGNGGDGFKGGGAGGSINGFSFFIPSTNTTAHASLDAKAGHGGNAIGSAGSGGAGGSIAGVSFSAQVPDGITGGIADNQFVTLNAGNGGNGAGSGKAGIGGSITKSNAQTIDNIDFTAGDGGNSGNKGKIGVGGSIGSLTAALGIFADSAAGSIAYLAGSAGGASAGTPSLGASGGSIINSVASAATNMSFTAGNGSYGGNGGNISQIAFYGATGNTALPDGNISVIAGNGGNAISSTTASGKGGSVTTAAGYTSSDATNTATFQAGEGGGGFGNAVPAGKTGGAGGSFTGLTIYGGAVSFSVVAGDGGNGTNTAGIGGSVTKIAVQANPISTTTGSSSGGTSSPVTIPNVNLYAIAAGNGGNVTTGKGALGGSVTNVNVAGNIGVLTGENYGYATDGSTMGGIFAGTGGTGSKGSGLNGNVTTITAQAISAIVAGRGASPALVNKVDMINLAGDTALSANADGSFANFPVPQTTTPSATAPTTILANVVGGKAGDPTLANAVNFQTTSGALAPSGAGSLAWTLGTTDPIDGLIAALTMTANRNFNPVAFLTTDATQASGYGIFLPPVPVVS